MADTAVGKTLTVDEGSRRKGGGPMPVPRLILALECSRPGSLSARYDLDGTCAIAIGRGTRRASERSGDPTQSELSVTVPDRWMSSRHARIEYSFGRWILVDAGSKNGSVVNGEPTTESPTPKAASAEGTRGVLCLGLPTARNPCGLQRFDLNINQLSCNKP